MANITIPSNITERGLLQPSDLLNLYDFINTGTWTTLTVGTLDVTGAAAFSYGPNYGADTGTAANTIVVTLSSSISAYADNLRVWTKPAYSNTGAATFNVNALGAKNIYGMNGTALQGGEYVANGMAEFIYDTSLDSGAGGFYLISSQGTLQVSPASASNQAVNLGQVTNAPPIFVKNAAANSTSISVTSASFTAPSAGVLVITGNIHSSGGTMNTITLSTSLAGLVNSTSFEDSVFGGYFGYLPMTNGQATTFTMAGTSTSAEDLSITGQAFFLPLA